MLLSVTFCLCRLVAVFAVVVVVVVVVVVAVVVVAVAVVVVVVLVVVVVVAVVVVVVFAAIDCFLLYSLVSHFSRVRVPVCSFVSLSPLLLSSLCALALLRNAFIKFWQDFSVSAVVVLRCSVSVLVGLLCWSVVLLL